MSTKSQISIKSTLVTALNNKTITNHQHQVYLVLLSIPKGKVTTYKEIAHKINCNSAQAIGQALRRNPFAPEVPCHRVVRTDLTLGGFSGSTGNETVLRKMKLLQSEGVKFQDTKVEDEWSQAKVLEDCVWTFWVKFVSVSIKKILLYLISHLSQPFIINFLQLHQWF